jgi:hypothetical protein
MKRYRILDSVMDIQLHDEGEWVKWDDVRNLEIAYKKIKLVLQLMVDAGEGK